MRASDLRAFERHVGTDLRSYAVSIARNISPRHKSNHDDWASEGILRFLTKCRETDPRVMKSFLGKVIHNLMIDEFRTARYQDEIRSVKGQQCHEVTVDQRNHTERASLALRHIQDERADSIDAERVLDTLGPDYAAVIRVASQGYTADEGAEMLGVTRPAFKSKLYRGQKKARKLCDV